MWCSRWLCDFLPDGYVAVDHVELDIKEMLELGKRAVSNHKNAINAVEVDATSTGSRWAPHEASVLFFIALKLNDGSQLFVCLRLRASNHYPHSTGSCKYPPGSYTYMFSHIWLVLQRSVIDAQSQMTVRSGPAMMRSLSLRPREVQIFRFPCKSTLTSIYRSLTLIPYHSDTIQAKQLLACFVRVVTEKESGEGNLNLSLPLSHYTISKCLISKMGCTH